MTTTTSTLEVEAQIKRKYEKLTEKLLEASADIEKYRSQLKITKKGIYIHIYVLLCFLS